MPLLLIAAVLSAEPSVQQNALLKTFREEFVAVTPGEGAFPDSFSMGRATGGRNNERPVKMVKMTQPFAIAKYEMPQNLYEAVMGENPSRWKGPRNSVEMLSYSDAVEFCEKATSLMRQAKLIGAAEVIRLPTETEWEYVARAGTTTVYSFGDDVKDIDAYAWHTGNAAGNDPPVGAKKPNAWDLYDIHGYLWEWTATPKVENGDKHVLRGGSWKDEAELLTSTYRRVVDGEMKDDAVGFRCVLAREAK